MKITKILPVRKRGWYGIWIDGKRGGLVSGDTLIIRKLKEGKEISEEELKEISKSEGYKKYLDLALTFLSYRPRTTKEIEMRLSKKLVDRETVRKVIEKLRTLNLLDDREFAKWFIKQRSEFRPRSKKALFIELRQKGIEEKLINEVLANEDSNLELTMAKKVAEKFLTRKRGLPKKELKERLFKKLFSLGFGYDQVTSVIDELREKM